MPESTDGPTTDEDDEVTTAGATPTHASLYMVLLTSCIACGLTALLLGGKRN